MQDIEKLLEQAKKLQKKKTPQELLQEAQEYIEGKKYGRKGKDGQDADENAITQRVLAIVLAQLPKKDELKGEKGDTPVVDYKSIINAVVSQIKPIKGDKGDTPKVDYDLIVSRVTQAIKVPEIDEEQIAITAINLIESFEGDDKLDVLKLKNLDKLLAKVKDFEIDAKKIKGIQDLLPKNPPMYAGGSGATFLKSMRDVDLNGLQDGYVLAWSASDKKFKPVLNSTPETQDLQSVTDIGSTTTNTITAQSFITTGGTSSDFVKGDGSLGSVDLSGYVPYTGATTNVNLGNYNFTATDVTADYTLTAGQSNVVTLATPSNLSATEVGGYQFSPTGMDSQYRIYAFKTAAGEKVFSYAGDVSYDDPFNPIGSLSVYGYQTYGSGYTAYGFYSEIRVYPYQVIGGVEYAMTGYYYGYNGFYDDNTGYPYDIQWSWDLISGADGYYVTKYSDETGYYHNYYIKITDSSTNYLLDTGTSIWTNGSTGLSVKSSYSLQLDWDAVPDAEGYRVFYNTPVYASYNYFSDTATNSFIDAPSTIPATGSEPTIFSGYGDIHNLYGSIRTNDLNFLDLPLIRGSDTEYITFRQGNVTLGADAGMSLASGSEYNMLAGASAGKNLKYNSPFNVALGYYALYEATNDISFNVAIGGNAGFSLIGGSGNTLIGPYAGYNLYTAGNNVYIGYTAGPQVTSSTGDSNIAIGTAALRANTSGSAGVAIGNGALFSNTTGVSNFAAGYNSLYNLPSGSYNFAAGYQSGVGFSKTTQFSLTLGYWANYLNQSNDPYGGTWYPINGDYQGAIGAQAVSQRTRGVVLGGARNSNFSVEVGIGHLAPMYPLSVAGTMFIADNIYTGLGAEKITNGTFTGNATGWTLGTGWAYSSNTVTKNANGVGTLSQTSAGMITPLVVGEIYQLEFTVSALTSGSFTVVCAGRTLSGNTNLNANSRYTYVFEAVTTGDIIFYPAETTSRFTIDNVSLKKVTAGDLIVAGAGKIKGALTVGGAITPASMTDASAPNGTIYYSTTASKLVYKDAGGTVNNLY